MASHASRRRRKVKAKAHPFDLDPLPARQPDGRRATEPADRLALDARARHLGLTLAVDEARREARAPWWGCLAGRLMAEQVSDEAGRVAFWGAIQHLRRVQAAYDAALGAPRRHAACLGILSPVPAMEADASSPAPDLREEVERVEAAERAWMEVQRWMMGAPRASRAAAMALALDDQGGPQAFVVAREALHNVVDGLSYRTTSIPTRRAVG